MLKRIKVVTKEILEEVKKKTATGSSFGLRTAVDGSIGLEHGLFLRVFKRLRRNLFWLQRVGAS